MVFFCCGTKKDREPLDEYDEIPFTLRWRARFGKQVQDPNSGCQILRLGKNRLIQTHCESTEYQALKLVAKNTSIPAYKVLAVYNRPEGKVVEYEGITGKPLHSMWPYMDLNQKRKVVVAIGRFVKQLREIEPPKHEVVGDSTLGATVDHRFGQAKIGPFYSIDAFHDFVRRGHAPQDFDDTAVSRCHTRTAPYQLKFTHANLCPRNVLVNKAGQVCALIGWEGSGWYPEYWEYIKMHTVISSDPKEDPSADMKEEWLDLLRGVVPNYDDELEADAALRIRFDSGSYERPRSISHPSPSASQIALEQLEIDDKNTSNTSG